MSIENEYRVRQFEYKSPSGVTLIVLIRIKGHRRDNKALLFLNLLASLEF